MSDKTPPSSGGPNRPSTPRKAAKPASGARKATATNWAEAAKPRARDLAGWSKARHIAKKTAKWALIFGLIGSLMGATLVYVTYKRIDIPDPNKDFQAQTTYVYYSDGKHLIGKFSLQDRQSIPLDEVPEHVQAAVIAAEDRNFYDNRGIDPKGIIRAAWSNARSSSTQGASTITQQYVKVLYLKQERTWKRKIREAFLSVKVADKMTKRQILEGYLNTIYYGRGAYGIQAAAQAYFNKNAKDLTVAEGAVLASVLNSPSRLDPAVSRDNRPQLLERYQYVLAGMVDTGALDPTQAEKLQRRLPPFPKIRQSNALGGQKGYMLRLVERHLQALDFNPEEIYGGGLKVVTTFDWNDQRAAVAAVNEVKPDGKPDLHVAIASIQPGTGALRAMYGGPNFLRSQINWAIAGGQPGSAFKPFALAAGLNDGYTLYDRFDGDSPYEFPDGTEIENQGENAGRSFGEVDLLTATENSINTAYIDMTMQMEDGPKKIKRAAIQAGIPKETGLDPYPAIALGSAKVPTVEMAEAYATFAAEGRHADWYVIEKVTDATGVRHEHEVEAERVFSKAITSNITYALQQVVESGSGTGAQAIDRPAAGKTGTATAEGRDGESYVSSSWFVGYTPQLATAVMYVRGDGNDPLNNGYLDTFYGGDYPTDTWAAYMEQALEGEEELDFPEPERLEGTQKPTVAPRTTTPRTTAPTTTAPPTTQAPSTTQTPTRVKPTTQGPPTTSGPTPTVICVPPACKPEEIEPTQGGQPTSTG